MSVLIIISYFVVIYALGILSAERFFFFCKPFHYERYFKPKVVMTILLMLALVVVSYVISTELLIGRKTFYVNLHCQLADAKTHAYIQLALVFAPTLFMIAFGTIQIQRLIKRQQQVVNALVLPQDTNIKKHKGVITTPVGKKAKHAVRLVLLLSGVFVGTHLPAYILRSVMFSIGISWEDVETRKHFTASVILRVEAVIEACVAPAFNPIVVFFINKDIRDHALDTLKTLKNLFK